MTPPGLLPPSREPRPRGAQRTVGLTSSECMVAVTEVIEVTAVTVTAVAVAAVARTARTGGAEGPAARSRAPPLPEGAGARSLARAAP